MSKLLSAQPTAHAGKGSTEHTKHGTEERQVKCYRLNVNRLKLLLKWILALVKGGELGALKTLPSLFQRQSTESRVQSAPDCAAATLGCDPTGNPAWAATACLAPLPAAELRSGNHMVKFHMQIQPQNRGWRAATWQSLPFDQSNSSNLIIQPLAWSFKQAALQSQRQWEIPNLVLWNRTREENSKDYKKGLYLMAHQENQKDWQRKFSYSHTWRKVHLLKSPSELYLNKPLTQRRRSRRKRKGKRKGKEEEEEREEEGEEEREEEREEEDYFWKSCANRIQ